MAQTTLHTRLCDILGIEYPVILAGMGAYAGPTLVAAVSNAGGLGVIGATGVPEDKLAEALWRRPPYTFAASWLRREVRVGVQTAWRTC